MQITVPAQPHLHIAIFIGKQRCFVSVEEDGSLGVKRDPGEQLFTYTLTKVAYEGLRDRCLDCFRECVVSNASPSGKGWESVAIHLGSSACAVDVRFGKISGSFPDHVLLLLNAVRAIGPDFDDLLKWPGVDGGEPG